MKQDPPRRNRLAVLSGGLSFRVGVFLSLALLPVGVLAINQTQGLTRAAAEQEDRLRLATTDDAVFGQRRLLERAIGVAEALAIGALDLRDNPDRCSAFLTDYVQGAAQYSFVGFLPLDGIMTCSNAGRAIDFSGFPDWDENISSPRLYVDLLQTAEVSQQAVLNLNHPVYSGDTFAGYLSLSIPWDTYLAAAPIRDIAGLDTLLTFDAEGEILSTMGEPALIEAFERRIGLIGGVRSIGGTVNDLGQVDGQNYVYAVVPVVPDVAFAVGIWPVSTNALSVWAIGLAPLLMWVASLAVAFLTLDRLVLRHIRRLAFRMRRFPHDRRFDNGGTRTERMPVELRSLEQSFHDMAQRLLQNEAKLEDDLRQKNVLLKEVHHRVKNNLQMISSIMNMQIRSSRHPETKSVLRRLQDRVLGLATVHRNLYQANDISRADAGVLLSETFAQIVNSTVKPGDGIRIDMDFEQIILFPDQAVPLSLLMSELATNALKYGGAPDGERRWIKAGLKLLEADRAELCVSNSKRPEAARSGQESDGTGLGQKLVQAFAMQLKSTADVKETADAFSVTVTFDVEDFTQQAVDH
ncbi:MAG: sensor histidine kinase [Pseudomonadota bacterium]